ncbi:MAG: phenylalanine 4-monooxygenase [Gammaproteobacteria bacterium RIFCSPHIGHO2_12_FULL_35_23]|nr:MAG: phenylalanine 4-monooxygenase [Gammaproteobacteria bacterium RIFCSPHIGHO2_12_FULL_35_23]
MTKYIAKQPDKKGYINFSPQEHQTWETLIKRQKNTIKNRACDEFFYGIEALNMSETKIPTLQEISESLNITSWKVMPVTGTVLVDEFFAMLARREFPVATFIRIPEELDYLQQPDIFHELFGHCPMLTSQAYADFVQWYGEFASSLTHSLRTILSRLFWFTIEFGLVKTSQGIRIYGGGILSSHQETVFALEDERPQRKVFSLHEVLLTKYRYDVIQDRYFIINSLESFYEMMDEKLLLSALHEIKSSQDNPFKTC